MILRQFLHIDPVAISYLFGCGGHAACAVVDPLGNIEPYLRVADETGMRIRFVVDTHVHADHRSAGRALASESGAEYVLYAGVDVGFPVHTAKAGDGLPLGNVVVDMLHTPGHTPEHVCLVVTHRTRADEPWFVLTGHTLMVGDVGRTELAEDAASGARALFTSLQRRAGEILLVLYIQIRWAPPNTEEGGATSLDIINGALDDLERLKAKLEALRAMAEAGGNPETAQPIKDGKRRLTEFGIRKLREWIDTGYANKTGHEYLAITSTAVNHQKRLLL